MISRHMLPIRASHLHLSFTLARILRLMTRIQAGRVMVCKGSGTRAISQVNLARENLWNLVSAEML